ncbi:MAG: nuclease-related domain-containing protein [Xanthomonadales bacterium]
MLIHLAWIAPLLLLVFFLGSPRFRGDIAERRIRRILAVGLERSRYTVFNDLVLPFGGGTVRIDHVVVSRFGIFVIESVYAPGRISGTAVQERWKRRRLGRIDRFDNPVHRNRVQVEALASALDFPMTVFEPLVVLVGAQAFPEPRPAQVVAPEKLLARLRRAGQPKLEEEQVARALHGIEAARLNPSAARFINRVALLRWLLFAALLSGLYIAFRDDLTRVYQAFETGREQAARPEAFHADGSPKTEREQWEDSLVCAWSADTGRCACYDPQGARVSLAPEKCRALAKRGSILEQ